MNNLIPFILSLILAHAHAFGAGGVQITPLTPAAASETNVGFTRLDPQNTGVSFSNQLSELKAAINRVYENGSGVAAGDVNGDGLCDVYFCGLENDSRLYINQGDWRFKDATEQAGVACSGQYSTGAVFADVDGDADLDLLVAATGRGPRLFLNDGGGRFTESPTSGFPSSGSSMSMALADADADGDLDLYVCQYRKDTFKDSPPGLNIDIQFKDARPVVSPPGRFIPIYSPEKGGVTLIETGEPDTLYLNDGKGTFSAISWTGGRFLDEQGLPLKEPPRDWGLTAMFRDVDRDGDPDLYVCNDFFYFPDKLWINDGEGTFRLADPLRLRTVSLSSMSVDFADIDRDGDDDFFVADMLSRRHDWRHRQIPNMLQGVVDQPEADSEFQVEAPRNTLYINRGDGTYAEISRLAGVHASEWTWTSMFLDVDLDGYEDLLVTNGHGHDVLDADTLAVMMKKEKPKSNYERLKNLQAFGPLPAANLIFKNRGDLTFEETGSNWGFNETGVSHGMAAADFDNDGDLDLALNNYNETAALYRNDANAPRIAVRLKGSPPNTQAVGARLTVSGGPVDQSQEIVAGGRYLSSSDPIRVFAGNSDGGSMTLSIDWPDGTRSRIEELPANGIVEVDEARVYKIESGRDSSDPLDSPYPFAFEDASSLLDHQHQEAAFDDFARQPLLPEKLSRRGPGVSFYDIDGDFWEDLIVGAGRESAFQVFRNDGQGGFTSVQGSPAPRDITSLLGWRRSRRESLILAGFSNYEDGAAKGAAVMQFNMFERSANPVVEADESSAGPLAICDLDVDGRLDLFVGGAVKPGRFPEPASSKIYRAVQGGFELDAANSALLENIGMVNGAVFSDVDGNGYSDLLLACDWNSIRLFLNHKGTLTDATGDWGLGQWRGRWNGIAAADFNGDGRMDLAASNWGRNTDYQPHLEKPAALYYADLDGNGTIEVVESYWANEVGAEAPLRNWKAVSAAMPWLQGRITGYRDFGRQPSKDLFLEHPDKMRSATINTLDAMVFLNQGGRFTGHALPVEAQWSPSFGIVAADFNMDGHEDLFLAQNFFHVHKDAVRHDSGRGALLKGKGDGTFECVHGHRSGVLAYGEGRGAAAGDFNRDGTVDLLIGQNEGPLKLYNNTGRPGYVVRLAGPDGNPHGVGAQVKIIWKDGSESPMKEVQSGSGYCSQNSFALRFGPIDKQPAKIHTRWPSGFVKEIDFPANALEVVIDPAGNHRILRSIP